eukprot:896612-Rhodomonas_salina.1
MAGGGFRATVTALAGPSSKREPPPDNLKSGLKYFSAELKSKRGIAKSRRSAGLNCSVKS